MKKSVLIITSLVLALAISCVVFSYTMDELKSVFVTREEFDKWANSNGATDASRNIIGMSEYIDGIENRMVESVYYEVGYQMYRRDILSNDDMSKVMEQSPSVYESWSIRRSIEIESLTSVSPVTYGAPKSSTVAPEEIASPSDVS